jgi:hypothetical protein
MSFSFNDVYWFPWEPFQKSRLFTISAGSGVKIVYFRVMDNANNIADPVFNSINLDSTPPHSLSIFINKGATTTNSSVVDLHLLAFDEFSGISQMSFSFDGVDWGEWYPFMSSKLLALPGNDGEKTVYFRVRDHAGNIAEPVFAQISLNTTIPEPETTEPEKKGSSTFELWQLLLFIIILLIISFIALTGYFSKRLKRLEQQMLVPGAYTIKPGGIVTPMVAVGDLGAHQQAVQLAGTTGVGVAAQLGQSQAAPIPILAKSTQAAQVTTTPASASGTAAQAAAPGHELPRLPPASTVPPAPVQATESEPLPDGIGEPPKQPVEPKPDKDQTVDNAPKSLGPSGVSET